MLLAAFLRMDRYLFHSRFHNLIIVIIPKLLVAMVSELPHGPEQILRIIIVLRIFIDTIICLMRVPIPLIVQRKLCSGIPYVAFLIKPNREGVPVSDHDPLSNIKFSSPNKCRVFDVFLDNPSTVSIPYSTVNFHP